VSARDPVIYVGATVGVLAIGALANLLPAYRAASVDPVRTLRNP
jgi:ABC-type lipoprotein release transport system permease subunit